MNRKMQVRVVSPWFGELDTPTAFFSSSLPTSDADALLCEWAPSDELFSFQGRKAWYRTEPPCQFDAISNGQWPTIRKKLQDHEFFWYGHHDPRFRIPASTHFTELTVDHRKDRKRRAIAVVSNFGGTPLRRHRQIAYRNRFATSHLVDLFGRESWKSYRRGAFSKKRAPENYVGSIPGDWEVDEKRSLMATYHVAVCLENMLDPGYFSEKFVEAVRAGCVPVFRAHPSVRDTFLKGASWVDPDDYGDDPEETIQMAIHSNREDVAQQNETWMRTNEDFRGTHKNRIYCRIAQALSASL